MSAVRSLHNCLLGTALLLLVACSDSAPAGTDTGADVAPDTPIDITGDPLPDPDLVADALRLDLQLQITTNPANPLSTFVEWETAEPGATELVVRCDSSYDERFARTDATTEHSVFVMGLVAESRCAVEARSVGPDGAWLAEGEAQFAVPELPDDVPDLRLEVPRPDDVAPGWTLFNLSNQSVGIPLLVVMVDEQGRYRWIHQRSGTYPGDATEVSLLDDPATVSPNGGGRVLIGGTRARQQPAIVTLEGQRIWEADLRQHHDIRPYGGDNELIYLAGTGACPDFAADTVVRYDLSTDTVLSTWSHCEHYLPEPTRRDWSHLNTVEPVPGTSDVILSSRNESALFRVDLDGGAIEWMMGFPLGAYEPSDLPRFTFPEGQRFWEQHAPEWQGNGRLLLFDNGDHDGRDHSRVIEIAFDEVTLEAEIVWEYRPDPDIFVPQWGDADRLPNGNVLSAWGERADEPSHVIEVRPDEVNADAELVWHLRTPNDWGIYRADRHAPIMGYVRAP